MTCLEKLGSKNECLKSSEEFSSLESCATLRISRVLVEKFPFLVTEQILEKAVEIGHAPFLELVVNYFQDNNKWQGRVEGKT